MYRQIHTHLCIKHGVQTNRYDKNIDFYYKLSTQLNHHTYIITNLWFTLELLPIIQIGCELPMQMFLP